MLTDASLTLPDFSFVVLIFKSTKFTSWAPRFLTVTPLVGPKGSTVAKSALLSTRRKVANHSPRNKTHLPEINKPQARITGVEISMCYTIDSNTCIEVTTSMGNYCQTVLGSLQVCIESSGTHVRWNRPLAVPSTVYSRFTYSCFAYNFPFCLIPQFPFHLIIPIPPNSRFIYCPLSDIGSVQVAYNPGIFLDYMHIHASMP
jgi:hypothetical protein